MKVRCLTSGCGRKLLIEEFNGKDAEAKVRCPRCKQLNVVVIRPRKGFTQELATSGVSG